MPIKDREKNKEYLRNHYYANKEQYYARNELARQRKRSYIQEQKQKPCTDCGEEYPYYVMDFDHREDNKLFNVSKMVAKSWNQIYTEIAKCDLVCSNCHRKRTYLRSLTPKAEGFGLNPIQC